MLRKNSGKTEEWISFPEAEEITFNVLNGKSVDPTIHTGRLTKVSADEKYGLLETEETLKPLQDLMLELRGQNAYAKVTGCFENGYRIGFTMKQVHLTGGGT